MTSKQNLALLCDFYELTMSQGYFQNNKANELCYFDIFFRKVPDKGTFAIFAGLESVLDFVENFHFNKEDLNFLKNLKIFDEKFLNFLADFKFTGTIYSLQEGEPIFPKEPIMCVKAKIIEAQLLETFLLLNINHQSLIASKTNRIVRAAKRRPIFEFGSRRAQGISAALQGARAAFIGGSCASACTLAGKLFDIPLSGTMAHSWVQIFDDEFEAFCEHLKIYPQNPSLLIDTYDCFTGLQNAIKAFKKFGIKKGSVRIDSGDLAYLSKEIRKRLDQSGFQNCKIIASNSLDEFSIEKLLAQNAPIDAFGVGERLITASSEPIFGCVYKLVANQKDGKIIPKIKISADFEKTTIPYFKKLFRIYDKTSKKSLYDMLFLHDEQPQFPSNVEAKELLKIVFKEGKRIYKKKKLTTIQKHCQKQISKLDEKFLKLKNTASYEVKLSEKLVELQNKLLKKI